MNSSPGQPVELRGKDATLRFNGIAHDLTSFEILREGFHQDAALPERYEPAKTPAQPNHMMDFFQCMRSRRKPKCHEEEGFIETVTFVMSVVAYREKRQVRWDPVQQAII
jgi:hypothetical protein